VNQIIKTSNFCPSSLSFFFTVFAKPLLSSFGLFYTFSIVAENTVGDLYHTATDEPNQRYTRKQVSTQNDTNLHHVTIITI